jgi:hypothetical protein
MKGFITMLCSFVILLTFVFVENRFVNNTSKELSEKLSVEYIKSSDDIENIVKIWNKKVKILRYFINHKELEKISIDIYTVYVFYLEENDEMYKSALVSANEKLKNLPEY